MKFFGLVFLRIIGLLPVVAAAQQPQVIGPDGWISEPGPMYKTKAVLRPGEFPVGVSAGIFGGANIAQEGNLDITSPFAPGVTASLDTKNAIGGVAGIRAAYTWAGLSGFDGLPPAGVDGSFRWLPSIQGEFFWTGYKYKAQQNFSGVNTTFTSDVNTYVLSLDPIMRFQVGAFRPYAGFGIGGAYITADSARVDASGFGLSAGTDLTGSSDCFAFAVQALAGCEYFFAQNWTVSLDYKYLSLVNPEFDSDDAQKSLHYSLDALSQHVVTVGVNFYF